MKWKGMFVSGLAVAALASTGCATKEYVREEAGRQTAAVHTRVDTLQGEVDEAIDDVLVVDGRQLPGQQFAA